MTDKMDIIILGATGYTGKHTVKNLASLVKSDYKDITWGIAGRSQEKLKDVQSSIQEIGVKDVPIMLCNVKDEKSLKIVTSKARVLLNCTGPNTLLSGAIVKSCIESGTDYVDISAELFHMLDIYRIYNSPAKQANTLIIPACGFASIPVVAGLIHLQNNFKGTLNFVECYVTLDIPKKAYWPGPKKSLVHYGTWESLVHELQNLKKFHRLKNEVFVDLKPVPENMTRSFLHKNHGKIWFPYPGPDESIIAMSQACREHENRPKYFFKSYTTMPLLIHFLIIPVFFLYYYLCYFKCFRNLLWRYPGVFTLGYFSHKGPSEQLRNDIKYSFTLYGKGVNSNNEKASLTVKVSGNDPGYRTTAISVICSAITVLKERTRMPISGVLTPETAFLETEIVDRLIKSGMHVEIIDENNKERETA